MSSTTTSRMTPGPMCTASVAPAVPVPPAGDLFVARGNAYREKATGRGPMDLPSVQDINSKTHRALQGQCARDDREPGPGAVTYWLVTNSNRKRIWMRCRSPRHRQLARGGVLPLLDPGRIGASGTARFVARRDRAAAEHGGASRVAEVAGDGSALPLKDFRSRWRIPRRGPVISTVRETGQYRRAIANRGRPWRAAI